MLKLTKNGIYMLQSRYRATLHNMIQQASTLTDTISQSVPKPWTAALLAGIMLWTSDCTALAADYHVGSGQQYETLQELVQQNINFAEGDIITLHNDDHSLTAPLRLNSPVTIQSADTQIRTISSNGRALYIVDNMQTVNNINFSSNYSSGQTPGSNGYGGAAYVAPNAKLTITATSFNSNTARGTDAFDEESLYTNAGPGGSGMGGAIYLTYATLNANDSMFSSNQAFGGQGGNNRLALPGDGGLAYGGALYLYNSDLNAENTTFSKNTALAGYGGINDHDIFADSGYSCGGAIATQSSPTYRNRLNFNNANFLNNAAQGGPIRITLWENASNIQSGDAIGGAIYAPGDELTFADTLFFQNSATGGDCRTWYGEFGRGANAYGGAIYLGSSTANFHNTAFVGNVAQGSTGNTSGQGYGGAIHGSSANLIFSADDGHTTLFVGNAHGNRNTMKNNSIYLNNSYDNTNSITIEGNGVVDMRDPLYSTRSYIYNDTSHSNITKNGAGSWKLGGINSLGANTTQFTVNSGTLHLYQDAAINILKSGSFRLAAGATLTSRGNNSIVLNSGSVAIDNDATLAFDLSHDNTSVANLTLTAPTISLPSENLNIDILSLNNHHPGQTFNLLAANGINASNKTLTLRGESFDDTRATADLSVSDNTLQLTVAGQNGQIKWAGPENGRWDATSNNWQGQDDLAGTTKFLHGDTAIFDNADGGAIAIQNAGVQVGRQTGSTGLIIRSGDWIFTGGAIEGSQITFTGSGSIAFDSRMMNQRITATDNAVAGVGATANETLTFTGFYDPAMIGGAIFSNDNATLRLDGDGMMDFKFNKAAAGAAIAATNDSNVIISSGINNFTYNQSTGNGGAIYADKIVTLNGGTNSFVYNQAERDGGAIYGKNISINNGANIFTDNWATGYGGAIFADENAVIRAGDNDVVFQGNRHARNTSSFIPNAIYVNNRNNNNMLTLAAAADHTLALLDPAASNDANANLVIAINPDAGDTGTVQFDKYQSTLYGTTTVHHGVLQLTGGATYGVNNPTGTFTLSSGAALAADTAGNNITAAAINLAEGSRLTFDLTGTAIESTPQLTLNGTVNGQAIGTGDIVLTGSRPTAHGLYTLVKTTDDTAAIGSSGILYQADGTRSHTRSTNAAFLIADQTDKKLNLALADTSGSASLTWNGSTALGGMTWDTAAHNWQGSMDILNNTHTIAVTQYLNGDTIRFTDTGAGTVAITAGGVSPAGITVDASQNYTFTGGSIGGASQLIKTGTGSLTLAGANTYSGGTQANAGILAIGNNRALGTGSLTMADATTLAFASSHSINNALNLSGNTAIDTAGHTASTTGNITGAHLTKIGQGSLTTSTGSLNKLTIHQGALNIASGKQLNVAADTALADHTMIGVGSANALQTGSLTLGNNTSLDLTSDLATTNHNVTVIESNAEINGNFNDIRIAGNSITNGVSHYNFIQDISVNKTHANKAIQISHGGYVWNNTLPQSAHGTFSVSTEWTVNQSLDDNSNASAYFDGWNGKTLTKTGDGYLTLATANSYTGGTILNQGTITVQHSRALGSGRVTTAQDTVLALDFDGTLGSGNIISGAGSLRTSGDITINHSNTYTGGTTIDHKTLTITAVSALGTGAITNNATLNHNTTADDTLTQAIGGIGKLVKTGSGDLTLSANNTYAGGTTINSGTLTAQHINALGSGSIATTQDTVLALDFDGTLGSGNTISGAGSLRTSGDITINHSNTYTGGTTIDSGILTATSADALGDGAITINTASILTLDFDGILNAGNTTSGSGSLITKGDITINHANTHTGGTAIKNGTLTVTGMDAFGTGSVTNNARLQFANPTEQARTIYLDSHGYSGSGAIGLTAAATNNRQWSDKLIFTQTLQPDHINVYFHFTPGSSISNIDSEGLLFAQLSNQQGDSNTFQLDQAATSLAGAYQLGIKTSDKQNYYLTTSFDAKLGKVYSEMSASDLALASMMHGQQTFSGISAAAQAARADNSTGIYAAMGRNNVTQQTGSHADLKGNNIELAAAWNSGNFTYGITGQKFTGSYKTKHHSPQNGINKAVIASGDLKQHGIGLFTEYRPADTGRYYQGIFKGGRVSNEFKANNAYQGSTFESGRTLLSMSVGTGVITKIGTGSIETYQHLIHTRLGSERLTDSIGQDIQLDSANSTRLLAGIRWHKNVSKTNSFYTGLAFDYEFDGTTRASIDGHKANNANLRGLSGLIEAGFNTALRSNLQIDGTIYGHIGKRGGLSGSLTLSKKF